MKVEVGKYYGTELKKLRACSLKVNEDGSATMRPLCSYWYDACKVILLCEEVMENGVIFREYNTNALVYGVDDLLNTSIHYDAISVYNYNDIKKNLLNDKKLWISKEDVHEIDSMKDLLSNIETAKSVNFLYEMSCKNLSNGLKKMCDASFDTGSIKKEARNKIISLKKGS